MPHGGRHDLPLFRRLLVLPRVRGIPPHPSRFPRAPTGGHDDFSGLSAIPTSMTVASPDRILAARSRGSAGVSSLGAGLDARLLSTGHPVDPEVVGAPRARGDDQRHEAEERGV